MQPNENTHIQIETFEKLKFKFESEFIGWIPKLNYIKETLFTHKHIKNIL